MELNKDGMGISLHFFLSIGDLWYRTSDNVNLPDSNTKTLGSSDNILILHSTYTGR